MKNPRNSSLPSIMSNVCCLCSGWHHCQSHDAQLWRWTSACLFAHVCCSLMCVCNLCLPFRSCWSLVPWLMKPRESGRKRLWRILSTNLSNYMCVQLQQQSRISTCTMSHVPLFTNMHVTARSPTLYTVPSRSRSSHVSFEIIAPWCHHLVNDDFSATLTFAL